MAVMQMVPGLSQDGDDPDTQGLADLAAAMPAEETQLLYSLCLHGRTELGLAPDEYAALTMVLLRLLAFKPQMATAEKKSPLASHRPATDAALAPPVALPPASVVTAPLASVGSETLQKTSSVVAAPAAAESAAPSPAMLHPRNQAAEPVTPRVAPAVAAPSESPPWEELADPCDERTDDAVDQFVASLPQAAAPAEGSAWRALPVRQASDSARVDVPKVAAVTPLQTTPEGDVWFGVVQGLMAQEAITALVRELALQSQLLARDSDQWLLRIERESLNHTASRERLQTALASAGHGSVRLQIELGPVADCPAKRMAVAAAAKMVAAQELIENDPLVQNLMRDFGAKIVPGSLKVI
jgi:DNA polymerase-3 subunit gamma/tau